MSDFLDTAQAHPDISSVFAQDDGASMIQMLLLYAPDAFIDYDAAQASFDSPRVYLKTPNAPGQRIFSRCAAPFFLEIRQYSCEKMSCSAQKFLAAGHIGSFQIHPKNRVEELEDEVSFLKSLIRMHSEQIAELKKKIGA